MNELVTNVVSRFNILDKPWPENDPWKDGSMKLISATEFSIIT